MIQVVNLVLRLLPIWNVDRPSFHCPRLFMSSFWTNFKSSGLHTVISHGESGAIVPVLSARSLET